ncbi:MAG: sporulation protein YqfD [bacterium]|nr:sporulation protein YqfD [bacterium]
MKSSVRKYLSGYLKIQIFGYSPERFLNLCSYQKINLWDLNVKGRTYEMKISVKDFRKLKPIIRKTKTKVKVVQRYGFPFFLQKYKTRHFLFAGLLMGILFLFFMSGFVWEIEIDGNIRCSDEEIRMFLKTMDISEGKRKKEISCDKIAEMMRENFDDVIWVSASVDGVELKIEVKENMDRIYEEEMEKSPPMDIVADKDGVVKSIITSKGKPMVKAGDEVKKGDILVSGTIEILNDAMEVTGYQYQVAEAEIYVQTEYVYEEEIEHTYETLEGTGKKKYQVWVENNDKIYFIGSVKNGYKYYKIYEQQKKITLGDIVPLPWKFGIKTVEECKKKTENYTEEEVRLKLSEKFHRFCQNLEKKGVQILKNDVKIYCGAERTSAKGILVLEEKTGETVAGERYKINENGKETY